MMERISFGQSSRGVVAEFERNRKRGLEEFVACHLECARPGAGSALKSRGIVGAAFFGTADAAGVNAIIPL